MSRIEYKEGDYIISPTIKYLAAMQLFEGEREQFLRRAGNYSFECIRNAAI